MSKRAAATTKRRRLYNRLGEILQERNISQKALAASTQLSTRTISRIVHQRIESIDLDTLESLCRTLHVQPGEIFCIDLFSFWSRIRKIGQACTHIGSGVCPTCAPISTVGAVDGCRESCGRWDVIAAHEMANLFADKVGISVEEHMHSNAVYPNGVIPVGLHNFMHDGRVHVIFGSPVSNTFAERVIAGEIYGVQPGSPSNLEAFPYVLVFPEGHVVSAFSRDGKLNECGIIDTQSGELVARRIFVPQGGGHGKDCALLIIVRTRPLRLDTSDPGNGEGMIICCCGHSGPATLACTKVLGDPHYASELFPSQVDQPIMRVVTAEYERPNSTKLADIRKLTSYELLPAPSDGQHSSAPRPSPLQVAG